MNPQIDARVLGFRPPYKNQSVSTCTTLGDTLKTQKTYGQVAVKLFTLTYFFSIELECARVCPCGRDTTLQTTIVKGTIVPVRLDQKSGIGFRNEELKTIVYCGLGSSGRKNSIGETMA